MKKLTLIFVALVTFGCKPEDVPSVPTGCAQSGLSQLTPSQIFGNDDPVAHPMSATIDGNNATYWESSTLNSPDDLKYISYYFNTPINVDCLEIRNDANTSYAMGNLHVFVSLNSSNGVDGDWEWIAWVHPSSHGFTNGDRSVDAIGDQVHWVRLQMVQDDDLWDVNGHFYLSEIRILGN